MVGLLFRVEADARRSGRFASTRYDGVVSKYFTPRCIGLHVTLLIVLPLFAWLTIWQLDRALGGNSLSWAYTIDWPLFGLSAIYLWWHPGTTDPAERAAVAAQTAAAVEADPESRPPGWALKGGRKKSVAIAAATAYDPETERHGERFVDQTPEEAAALERYNRYLASLADQDDEVRR